MKLLPLGADAPDFTLRSHLGDKLSLSSYRGRQHVVLVFFPMAFTGGCTQQLCALRDDYARFAAAGAAILGISRAPGLVHRAFAARHGYQFPILADPGQRVAQRYGAYDPAQSLLSLRTVYVVGRDGRVRFAKRGMPSDATILEAIEGQGDG